MRSKRDSSWDVRNPSKKCKNGTCARKVAACATAAKSCDCCTLCDDNIAKPVPRTDITSLWSPNIDNACVANARAATCITNGRCSPAILYMFGIINNNPWDAVNVVAKDPICNAPCIAPAAPPSDSISIISGIAPQMFFLC